MLNKERPILYSTPMVVAILEGRKTKTRRMTGLEEVNADPDQWTLFGIEQRKNLKGDVVTFAGFESSGAKGWLECPYGKPGDVLWVRETWTQYLRPGAVIPEYIHYRASHPCPDVTTWKPSIHMKKIHARIWLQITDIKAERLWDISKDDAIAEGISIQVGRRVFYRDYTIPNAWYFSPTASFFSLWRSINGRESWTANPWVWVISFKVLSKSGKPANLQVGKEVAHA